MIFPFDLNDRNHRSSLKSCYWFREASVILRYVRKFRDTVTFCKTYYSAQETLKRYSRCVWKLWVNYATPKFDDVFLDRVTSVISEPTILTSQRPLLITYSTHQIRICAAKHTQHTNFIQCTPKMGFFRGEFLFVRRKRHVCFKSVFSSYQVVVQEDSSHTRFRWSYFTLVCYAFLSGTFL